MEVLVLINSPVQECIDSPSVCCSVHLDVRHYYVFTILLYSFDTAASCSIG